MILPDVLQPGLKVVFCGTAASNVSAAVGAYYAGPGNAFWPTLYATGLTPRLLQPREFRSVLDYGLGLTDLAKHASGVDAQIPPDAFDVAALVEKLQRFAPRIVALTSKAAGRILYGHPVNVGWQPEGIGMARVCVLPSPSGAARRTWDPGSWQALADTAAGLEEPG
jgi:TDG/mug DNA glycosylase family protein